VPPDQPETIASRLHLQQQLSRTRAFQEEITAKTKQTNEKHRKN